jgi:myo-inositol-1(or 4)-monophosphatase
VPTIPELVATCEEAARAGGRTLLEWRRRFRTWEKGPADLVTDADLASQEAIREVVASRFADHEFLGEETPGAAARATFARAEWTWVVDPLDGTTNYVHGLAQYSVSVAVLHRGEAAAGCVFDPVTGECYTAGRGEGSRLGGERIAPSGQTDLSRSLVAVSFPARIDHRSPEIVDFLRVLPHCQAFRRMGSAALNLCYVASGALDAYWSTSTKMWDIAAGALLVEESGGAIGGIGGGRLDLARASFIAAATSELARRIQDLLADETGGASSRFGE